MKEKLNKLQKVLFWYSTVITLGLNFLLAWSDGIKPSELMEWVR